MKAFLITLDGIEKEIDVDENTWEVRELMDERPIQFVVPEDERFKEVPSKSYQFGCYKTYCLSSYNYEGIPVFRELGSYD